MRLIIQVICILLGTLGAVTAQADDEPDFKGLLAESTRHLKGFKPFEMPITRHSEVP